MRATFPNPTPPPPAVFAVTKFIRIGISDKNDNPPYFDKRLYEAEVDENEDIQHIVLTVVAKDIDECEWPRVVGDGERQSSRNYACGL